MKLRSIWAIAWQTLTEARRNKVFYSLFLFALVVVLNSYIFTEVTITTMDRVLKDTGMAAINVFAILLTIFTGVGVINREIDRKSVFSIIAKPIARFEFILGKYLGLLLIALATSGAMFLGLLIALKVYRAPFHPAMLVGLYGVLLEVLVLGAFAVLCSSFTSAFVSAFMCIAIFVSGHLSSELLVSAKKSASELSRAMGKIIYYVMPNLERFNFKYNVTYDVPVPAETLITLTAYAGAYVLAFLVAAAVIFSNRDFR